MSTITASQVKQLRERTGSGMMECKKALQETQGDIEKAIELMRKKGMAKADKKAGRTTAEGQIVIAQDSKRACLLEINSETDFVAKHEDFSSFAQQVAAIALSENCQSVEQLAELSLDNETVEQRRRALIAKIGENITLRRLVIRHAKDNAVIGSYLHGHRIGVLAVIKNGDDVMAKDIAMHVAASGPAAIDASGVPSELLQKERDIFAAQAAESGKPQVIIEKMVEGRIQKYLKEVTLVHQPFVKNPDQSVAEYLKSQQASVVDFIRFELGEGIEKQADDFVAEVMAQAKGNA